MFNTDSIIKVMHQHGISPKNSINIIPDGKIHRYKAIDDKNSNGWYIVFPNGNGVVGHWAKYGEKRFFVGNSKDVKYSCLHQHEIKKINKKQEINKKIDAEKAKIKTIDILKNSVMAKKEHAYLQKKQIALNNIRSYQDNIIVNLYKDHLKLQSLQLIGSEGKKKFLKGTIKKGAYSVIGPHISEHPIIIAEGFATAANIYQSLDIPVFIAFDCGNLQAAIETIIQNFSFNGHIIIAADNDLNEIGYRHAHDALQAISCRKRHIIMPDIVQTDWNDVYITQGKESVKKSFAKVLL